MIGNIMKPSVCCKGWPSRNLGNIMINAPPQDRKKVSAKKVRMGYLLLKDLLSMNEGSRNGRIAP